MYHWQLFAWLLATYPCQIIKLHWRHIILAWIPNNYIYAETYLFSHEMYLKIIELIVYNLVFWYHFCFTPKNILRVRRIFLLAEYHCKSLLWSMPLGALVSIARMHLMAYLFLMISKEISYTSLKLPFAMHYLNHCEFGRKNRESCKCTRKENLYISDYSALY